MNFIAAMKVLLAGGSVRLSGITYKLDDDGISLINVSSEEVVELTIALLDATTYAVVSTGLRSLGSDQIYAVFSEEKARWVSTTDAAKHKAAGKRVAVFALDELI